MALFDAGPAAAAEAANASSLNRQAAPDGAADDEFGRWLAGQSELFRGKRAAAQVPALLNPALARP